MDESGGSGGGGVGGTAQACAACKHQRRKCGPGCPMARYFPASRSQEFRDVYRLFGLGNVTKVHNSLPPGEERDAAMTTMILEAGMWREDPVRGACGLIRQLLQQIDAAKEELDAVTAQLALYRWPYEIPRSQLCPSSVLRPQHLLQADGGMVKPTIRTVPPRRVGTELQFESSSSCDQEHDSKFRLANNRAHRPLDLCLRFKSTSSKLE